MPQIQESYNCPMKLTMDLIGGKWKLTILWYLNEGTKRFNEIKKFLPDITQKILTEQLREMEENDLIVRKVYAVIPPKVEYSTTEYGKKLQVILNQMSLWGNEYAECHDINIC
ncbi:MAG: winged helix-turn-helix transcriptional regulator [Solirubrobacterales bacterium]